jgi:hypothetical protein
VADSPKKRKKGAKAEPSNHAVPASASSPSDSSESSQDSNTPRPILSNAALVVIEAGTPPVEAEGIEKVLFVAGHGIVKAVRIDGGHPDVVWETQCRKHSLVDRRHEEFASQIAFSTSDSSLIVSGMHHLYKIDALTGSSLWRSSSLGSFTTLRPYPTSFLFHEQHIYAGYCCSLSKLDPQTGKSSWRVKMGTGAISPTVLASHKEIVFVAGAGHVVAVDRDGVVQWRDQFSQTSTRPVSILHNGRTSYPLLYIGHRGKIYVYNTESQTRVKEWRSGTKGFVTMLMCPGHLVVATPSFIWALQPKSLETIWKQSLLGTGSTVALQMMEHNLEAVVIASIYHNGDRSTLSTYRLLDGSPRWGTLTFKSGLCSGSASIIYHDGYICVGSSGGIIQGLHVTNKSQRFRFSFGRSWLSFANSASSSDTHAAQPIVQEQSATLINPS